MVHRRDKAIDQGNRSGATSPPSAASLCLSVAPGTTLASTAPNALTARADHPATRPMQVARAACPERFHVSQSSQHLNLILVDDPIERIMMAPTMAGAKDFS
jgi:hypothetical protein